MVEYIWGGDLLLHLDAVNMFFINFILKEDGAERGHISSLYQDRSQLLPISGSHHLIILFCSGYLFQFSLFLAFSWFNLILLRIFFSVFFSFCLLFIWIFFADPILVQDSSKADANVLWERGKRPVKGLAWIWPNSEQEVRTGHLLSATR